MGKASRLKRERHRRSPGVVADEFMELVRLGVQRQELNLGNPDPEVVSRLDEEIERLRRRLSAAGVHVPPEIMAMVMSRPPASEDDTD